MENNIVIIVKIALLIFLYYLIYYIYIGLLHPIPALGDSWDYHIPISQTILNGTFITLPHVKLPQWYYPGSSEAINSLLLFLYIPLTLSNILAIICLLVSCWKLGLTFRLPYYAALLFALSFCGLTVIVRWMNAVSIDVWVAVFFVLTLILLEKPQKKWSYFLKLGFTSGMLIGSKYTAILFLLFLFFIYSKSLFKVLNPIRILWFLVPFSIFGLFWYIRNYILIHNPFYPLSILGFKGYRVFDESIWHVTLLYPLTMLNAFFSEYKLWIFILICPLLWLIYRYLTKTKVVIYGLDKLFTIGLINFLLFTQLPTSVSPWIMVSSFRYSYPIFIPLMLGTFLLANKYHKMEWLGYISIICMLNTLTMAYYPKLILFYLPIAAFIFYLFNKKEKKV